jgi:general secretion pathway protein C
LNLKTKIDDWENQSTTEILASINQHLPFWVSCFAVVMISWYLTQIIWALFPTPISFSGLAAKTPSSKSMKNKSNYSPILESHLFGVSAIDEVSNEMKATTNAPETKLNIKLHGSIMSSDQRKSHAIIGEKGKGSEVYFIGDSISSGAKLHEVQANLVVLNRGGVLETLRLPDVAIGNITSTSKRTAPRGRNYGARSIRNSLSDDGESITKKFTDIVRPQPYMPNGKLKGYRIYPGRDRKKFAALGLRPGDLITDINGVPLNNMTDGIGLFQSLGSENQVTVTLERNGQSKVLSVDTSQIIDKDGK